MFRAGLEPLLKHVTHIDPYDADAVRRETHRGDVAALIIEPIQGEGGVRPLDWDVLATWARDVHAAGASLVSDEIQVGLRRCGPFSLAIEHGLRPDAVLFGKALGGGILPLAAMVATADFYWPLVRDPTWHSLTFGGHPLSCAAGSAALNAIDELSGAATRIARQTEAGLQALRLEHEDLITDVRGAGLLWGIELASPAVAGSVLSDLGVQGLLVSPCLSRPETIRLLPPMVTTDAQLDRALNVVASTMESAQQYLET
jgi:putrescine aminotransferase